MGDHISHNAANIDHAATQSYLMPPRIIKLIEKATSGRQIADAWREWLNPVSRSATAGPCPGYCFDLLQDKSVGRTDKHGLNIDGVLYKKDKISIDNYPRWETPRLLIKFKCGDEESDTSDDEAGDDASDTLTDFQGQIAPHVAKAFSQQHRVAMFFLLVDGNKLRIVRWDHSGTSFTEQFDYTEQRERLRNVLSDFSQLSDGQQGFDTTATLLTPDHPYFELMHSLTHDKDTDISEVEGTVVPDKQDNYTFCFVRKAFSKSIENDAPRYILTVPGAQGEREFLVGNATFVTPGMTGRGTRGYVAWDITGERFTFLKDAWRHGLEDVSTEGRVLQGLRSAGVENIPTYVCDGELAGVTQAPLHRGSRGESGGLFASQSGRSQSSRSRAGSKRKKKASTPRCNASASIGVSQAKQIPAAKATNTPQEVSPKVCKKRKSVDHRIRHYRVVVEEVCLPLETFTTGKQLIAIIRDCVIAHEGAVTKAKVLHRDISTGNILICPTVEADEKGVLRVKWRGVLADWEMSKTFPDPKGTETAGQVVRTGTWQFTSAYILNNPEEPVQIPDEIESFFHVTLYNALRYTRANSINVPSTMYDFFDYYRLGAEGKYYCGTVKEWAMESGVLRTPRFCHLEFLGDDGRSDSQPLNIIFHIMLKWFKARYEMLRPPASEDELALRTQCEEYQVSRRDRKAQQGSRQQPEGEEAKKQKEPPMVQPKPSATQLNVDTHTELLDLLDLALEMDWPEKDVVGDQLGKRGSDQDPDSQPDPQSGANHQDSADDSPTSDAAAADDINGDSNGDHSEDESESDPDEPSAKRRRS